MDEVRGDELGHVELETPDEFMECGGDTPGVEGGAMIPFGGGEWRVGGRGWSAVYGGGQWGVGVTRHAAEAPPGAYWGGSAQVVRGCSGRLDGDPGGCVVLGLDPGAARVLAQGALGVGGGQRGGLFLVAFLALHPQIAHLQELFLAEEGLPVVGDAVVGGVFEAEQLTEVVLGDGGLSGLGGGVGVGVARSALGERGQPAHEEVEPGFFDGGFELFDAALEEDVALVERQHFEDGLVAPQLAELAVDESALLEDDAALVDVLADMEGGGALADAGHHDDVEQLQIVELAGDVGLAFEQGDGQGRQIVRVGGARDEVGHAVLAERAHLEGVQGGGDDEPRLGDELAAGEDELEAVHRARLVGHGDDQVDVLVGFEDLDGCGAILDTVDGDVLALATEAVDQDGEEGLVGLD